LLLLLDTLGLLLAILQVFFSVEATTNASSALVIIITSCHFAAGSCPEVVELDGFYIYIKINIYIYIFTLLKYLLTKVRNYKY
jgi:hypothetical protein